MLLGAGLRNSNPILLSKDTNHKLAKTYPITAEDVIEQLVQATNQTCGSILAVRSELDMVILQGLRNGRIVQLPNGTHYQPYGKKDGSINVKVHLNRRMKQ